MMAAKPKQINMTKMLSRLLPSVAARSSMGGSSGRGAANNARQAMVTAVASLGFIATATATATTGISCTSSETPKQQVLNGPPPYRIESAFMEKLSRKSYVQNMTVSSNRSSSIPSTLRIMAIDLPEMRTNGFTGNCQLSHDKIFSDDVAPPKTIEMYGSTSVLDVEDGDEIDEETYKKSDATQDRQQSTASHRNQKSPRSGKRTTLKVSQKALVQSLVLCKNHRYDDDGIVQESIGGVELLEASVENLNQYKLRKVHQFGAVKYDPGKYYDRKHTSKMPSSRQSRHDDSVFQVERGDRLCDNNDEEMEEVDLVEQELNRSSISGNMTHEYELEAPWNQYAWIEELRLRVSDTVGLLIQNITMHVSPTRTSNINHDI